MIDEFSQVDVARLEEDSWTTVRERCSGAPQRDRSLRRRARCRASADARTARAPAARASAESQRRRRRGDAGAGRRRDGTETAAAPADFTAPLAERVPQGAAGHLRSVHAASSMRRAATCRTRRSCTSGPCERRTRRRPGITARRPDRQAGDGSGEAEYPVDAIFPVELTAGEARHARVSRGFSIAPGDYDVYVVVRERPRVDGVRARRRGRRS